jgi:hypothetical protein
MGAAWGVAGVWLERKGTGRGLAEPGLPACMPTPPATYLLLGLAHNPVTSAVLPPPYRTVPPCAAGMPCKPTPSLNPMLSWSG